MLPDDRFKHAEKAFWANVRAISEAGGYSVPRMQRVKAHTVEEICAAMISVGLQTSHLVFPDGTTTTLAQRLHTYLRYRADMLNGFVEPRLMDSRRARAVFEEV